MTTVRRRRPSQRIASARVARSADRVERAGLPPADERPAGTGEAVEPDAPGIHGMDCGYRGNPLDRTPAAS